jgi:hypothetical protein
MNLSDGCGFDSRFPPQVLNDLPDGLEMLVRPVWRPIPVTTITAL